MEPDDLVNIKDSFQNGNLFKMNEMLIWSSIFYNMKTDSRLKFKSFLTTEKNNANEFQCTGLPFQVTLNII